MTVRDLDRLVTRTDMNAISKEALKGVRRAVISGRCGDASIGEGEWSVSMDSDGGAPLRMTFSFRRG